MRRFRRLRWRRARRALLYGVWSLIGALGAIGLLALVDAGAGFDYNAGWAVGIVTGAVLGYYVGGTDEPARDVVHLRVRHAENLLHTLGDFAELACREGITHLDVNIHNEAPPHATYVRDDVSPEP